MKLTVIVPTLGRGNLVETVIDLLRQQDRPPDAVIVSAASEPIRALEAAEFPIRILHGSAGLCAQRNRALDLALEDGADVVTFFDDDFLPGPGYLRAIETAFATEPRWQVVMGRVLRDGACGAGLTVQEGLAILAGAPPPRALSVRAHPGAYGCNMSIRTRNIGAARFDERLVLYGWQEDIDFTARFTRYGSVVGISTAVGVHLGAKNGRVSGLRLGYSQIANPIYLIRKGTMSPRFALELMARNLMANCVRSFAPEHYIDRRGRLRGNLLALLHLARGRVEPEFILKL